ncbi:CCA tRNA nucleotidyltransferase [Rhodospira trueperi]|uniref:Poly(A) polymerase n=1 Tax=Rhodospira trueperi TaxID=69960 RepID=A0A1G7G1H0_9PROT|nr:CCA tRNA nucleotidyltransferase [Rhodospira trueperi]SDE81875.1 poly(A) polymerase [Rhodospira trueperi]
MTRDWTQLKTRTPVGQLSPDPWMKTPGLRRLLAALSADGTEVRLIGGCVRDGLLRRPVKDVDIATPDRPEVVQALLARADIGTVPWRRGLEHGTVLAVVDETPFEVTTLRRDVRCDGRHAEVAFTEDWTADAARRDFTINTLSATPDGAVFDYFDGITDLSAGRVRFVGRAIDRIREDALRILRFFRFHAHYAHTAPDKDAFTACQALAETVDDLSGERVRAELLKILMASDPAGALLLVRAAHVLRRILPEAERFDVLRILAFLETRGVIAPGVVADDLRRLAAVLNTDEPGAVAVAERLRLSRRETQRLAEIAALPARLRPRPEASPADRRRLLDQLGPSRTLDLILVEWAAERARNGHTDSRRTAAWMAAVTEATAFAPPPFPLTGHDLIAAGVPRGPALGAALTHLRDWWLIEDFRPDRGALLERIRDLGLDGGEGGG